MSNRQTQRHSRYRLAFDLWFGGAICAAVVFAASLAHAQSFDSGSDGSDGALDFTGQAGTIVFDPNAFDEPLDPEGDNVYHFTTITIPTGVTIKLTAEKLGAKPVVWLASGTVRHEGIIDLDGEDCGTSSNARISAVAGAGGFGGGLGSADGLPATAGFGPGGGAPCPQTASGQIGYGGAGGHAVEGSAGSGTCNISAAGGASYGNPFLLPLIGGSGGAGSTRVDNALSVRGGAGGGALLIASSTNIVFGGGGTNGGDIRADGGWCNATTPRGGGSGGAIRLIAPHISGGVSGTNIRAFGQSGGSDGRIRIEAFENELTATFLPQPTFGTPFAGTVFLPDSVPRVSVVSINGAEVLENPTGSFIMPDVNINTLDAVTVVVEGRNVPLGKTVQLQIMPENAAPQIVNTSPLVGTLEVSTATAEVTFERGFSRIFIQASIR